MSSLHQWKHRKLDFGSGLDAVYSAPGVTPQRYPVKGTGYQSTWTRENLWKFSKDYVSGARTGVMDQDWVSKVDVGGEFLTRKNYYEEAPDRVFHMFQPFGGSSGWQFDGKLLAVARPHITDPWTVSGRFPAVPPDQKAEMIQMGTTAIARTIPTHPAVGVAQFLGELKEGLPSAPGMKLGRGKGSVSKKFADEYLNYEFGIKPIVSDLKAFAEATRESNKILAQLKRDSGRLVRRRYSFPEEVTRTKMSADGVKAQPYPAGMASSLFDSGGNQGPYEWWRTVTKRTWFSGAYTYFYDHGDSTWSRIKQAEQDLNRLYGLRITPELLWELAPWSWLADWETNIGDVMVNLSAFSQDSLVLRWGYVMQTIDIRDTHTLTVAPKGYGSVRLTQTFGTVIKRRVRATPYGFGLDPGWQDLSSRQLAILSALGISRVF
jgi:hypothetical protein